MSETYRAEFNTQTRRAPDVLRIPPFAVPHRSNHMPTFLIKDRNRFDEDTEPMLDAVKVVLDAIEISLCALVLG